VRAIRVDQLGGPEVLKLGEVMLPSPENGQPALANLNLRRYAIHEPI